MQRVRLVDRDGEARGRGRQVARAAGAPCEHPVRASATTCRREGEGDGVGTERLQLGELPLASLGPRRVALAQVLHVGVEPQLRHRARLLGRRAAPPAENHDAAAARVPTASHAKTAPPRWRSTTNPLRSQTGKALYKGGRPLGRRPLGPIGARRDACVGHGVTAPHGRRRGAPGTRSQPWLAPGWLAGEGSNLQPTDPKSVVLPIELPATGCRGSARRWRRSRALCVPTVTLVSRGAVRWEVTATFFATSYSSRAPGLALLATIVCTNGSCHGPQRAPDVRGTGAHATGPAQRTRDSRARRRPSVGST